MWIINGIAFMHDSNPAATLSTHKLSDGLLRLSGWGNLGGLAKPWRLSESPWNFDGDPHG